MFDKAQESIIYRGYLVL